jgi:hypothetical protein
MTAKPVILKLNVGGVEMQTHRSTFLRAPALYEHFGDSEKGLTFAVDDEGRYFLDRDPERFAAFLRACRGGGVLDRKTLRMANDELAFWNPNDEFMSERSDIIFIRKGNLRQLVTIPNTVLDMLPGLYFKRMRSIRREVDFPDIPVIVEPEPRCVEAIQDLVNILPSTNLLQGDHWHVLSWYFGLVEKLKLDISAMSRFPKTFDHYADKYHTVLKRTPNSWVIEHEDTVIYSQSDRDLAMGSRTVFDWERLKKKSWLVYLRFTLDGPVNPDGVDLKFYWA